MVRESHLRKEQLVLPLFVTEGTQKRIPVNSMPGVFQLSIDELLAETRSAWETGVRAILLFGIPDHKDEKGSSAYDPEGITQRAVRALRKEFPDLIIITDVCLCVEILLDLPHI